MTNQSTPWRVEVKYGPDGEENYAWVLADNGALIGTFKTHHAHTVANAVNAYDKQRALIEAVFKAVSDHPENSALGSTVRQLVTKEQSQ